MTTVKFDMGKPALMHLPPSYWHRAGNELCYQIANWFFYNKPLPTLKSLQLHYDPVVVFEWAVDNKYKLHSWHRGLLWSRIVSAFYRHTNKKIHSGIWSPRDLDELDEETKLPHGCHAAWQVVVLNEYVSRNIGTNDCPWKVNEK